MKHGLIGLSAKPYHRGHDELIRTALKECNVVSVFVSTTDRIRPGEAPILWRDMEPLWRNHIAPSLGKRTNVTYGGSPIRKIYETLGAENDAGSDDTYVIYSDPDDLERNFPSAALQKYAGDLYARGKVVLEPIQRSSTCDVSGTQMRKWLAEDAAPDFMAHLPSCLPPLETWSAVRSTYSTLGRIPKGRSHRS